MDPVLNSILPPKTRVARDSPAIQRYVPYACPHSSPPAILIALRDVGVTPPSDGDASDEQIRANLANEMAGRRRPRLRVRMPHRPAVRFATVGTAAAVAAGVIVASGLGRASSTPRLAFPGVHASRVPSVQSEDTAYIVSRVKARVAAAQTGTVVRYALYSGGDVTADGSLVNLGWKMDEGYEYAAPDSTQYAHDTMYYQDGSIELATFEDWTPGATADRGTDTETVINPDADEYSQTRYEATFNPNLVATPRPDVFSTPAQIQQALQSGRVTQQGTLTIDGTQAIALSMIAPNAPGNPSTDVALYVDAQTYEPLRTVAIVGSDLTVSDWVPAAADNIAAAKDESIPAGYTKTTPLQVNESTRRGNTGNS